MKSMFYKGENISPWGLIFSLLNRKIRKIDYADFQNLSQEEKDGGTLWCVVNAPDFDVLRYYPVGCYFETTDTTFDPNTEWGGTWVLEAEGLVHISSGSSYVVTTEDQDGGAPSHNHIYNHTHTVPGSSHFHWTPILSDINNGVSFRQYQPWNYSWTNVGTTKVTSPNYQNLGGSPTASSTSGYQIGTTSTTPAAVTTSAQSTNITNTEGNMQPYKIVNRWHRTA